MLALLSGCTDRVEDQDFYLSMINSCRHDLDSEKCKILKKSGKSQNELADLFDFMSTLHRDELVGFAEKNRCQRSDVCMLFRAPSHKLGHAEQYFGVGFSSEWREWEIDIMYTFMDPERWNELMDRVEGN